MKDAKYGYRIPTSKRSAKRAGLIAALTLGGMTLLSLIAPSGSEGVCAQKSECPACLLLITGKGCAAKTPTPTVTPTPTATPPLPPIKRREQKSVFPTPPRFVGDKDLPGLDEQSGTALDVGDNAAQGERYERASGYTGVGRYQERRLYILKTLEKGRLLAAAGEIPQSNLTQLTRILREKLDRISEQERSAYQEALGDKLEAEIQDVNTNVDKQNAERAAMIEKQIENMDIEQFDKLQDAISQVIDENFKQAREQEMLGQNSQEAQARVTSIINKLRKKFLKDCGKKKLNSGTTSNIERTAQLLGMSVQDSEIPAECQSRTLVARISLPGFDLEAKKCLSRTARYEDAYPFDGDWQLTVTGVMPMQGRVTITSQGRGGDWEAKSANLAAIHGDGKDSVVLKSSGAAEVISSGGQCLLWLKPGDNPVDYQTEKGSGTIRTPFPLTGRFPITIENKTCDVKPSTSGS